MENKKPCFFSACEDENERERIRIIEEEVCMKANLAQSHQGYKNFEIIGIQLKFLKL